jgi:GNAT superfamily N-acetyltransferase
MFDAQFLLKISGISTLTFEDEQLFRMAFANELLQYAHSWLYVLRAAHVNAGSMGFKFISQNLVAVIGYRHNCIYVTPIFDTTGGVKLQQLCEVVTRQIDLPILIKKMRPAVFDQLSYRKVNATQLLLEDDSHPEMVLHLNRLFISSDGTLNPTARKLQRRALSFEQLDIDLAIVENITTISFEKIKNFLALDAEKYASYLPIIRYLYTQKPDRYKYRVVIFIGRKSGRIRGLYMTEVLSLTDVGMYGGITTKDVGGITEWMDVYFFRQLFLDGIRTVHLGGAENQGIANYVRKLVPYKPAYLTQTVLFSPERAEKMAFKIRLVKTADFMALAQLYRTLYNSLNELGELWTKETAHRFISHFYDRQGDLFFLAEHKGKIVGAIVAGLQPWWDGNHLVEGELIVEQAYQRTNVHRQLLKELLTKARQKYDVVAWDTFTPATPAHPLSSYKEIGFNDVPQWAAISGDVHTVLERLGV